VLIGYTINRWNFNFQSSFKLSPYLAYFSYTHMKLHEERPNNTVSNLSPLK